MLSISRISKGAPLVMLFCLLGAPSSAEAQSEEGSCSNRSLSGSYGFAIEGLIFAIPGAPAQASSAPPASCGRRNHLRR
jgi:hypothetical protein